MGPRSVAGGGSNVTSAAGVGGSTASAPAAAVSRTPAAVGLAASSAAAIHVGSHVEGGHFEAITSPTSPNGFYQGSGVLTAANRPCAAHDAARITMQQNQVTFQGANTGAMAGSSGSGSQLRAVDVSSGSARLVGNFGNGSFVGSLSNAGCVYDYTLYEAAKPEQLATPTPALAPVTPSLDSSNRPADNASRPADTNAEDRSAAVAAKKAQHQAAAQRLARRGEQLFGAGRIVEARRLFERAALAGNARGALGLGMTYDPVVLSGLNSQGALGDALVAKIWYRRAEMFGDHDAKGRLAKLEAWRPG